MNSRNDRAAEVLCHCGKAGLTFEGGRQIGLCHEHLTERMADMKVHHEVGKTCTHPNARSNILKLPGRHDRYCPDCWEWALDGVFRSER